MREFQLLGWLLLPVLQALFLKEVISTRDGVRGLLLFFLANCVRPQKIPITS